MYDELFREALSVLEVCEEINVSNGRNGRKKANIRPANRVKGGGPSGLNRTYCVNIIGPD